MTGNGNSIKNHVIIIIFLSFWFLLSLIQSAFTGLAHDEAYYWMYSRYLAWGYFDHPPLVAVLIHAGAQLFSHELGVRFMFCILGTLTLLLTWRISRGSPWLFMLITSSIALVHSHVAGFLAIPDVPLVFFTALFFYIYKLYIERDSTLLAVLLGIAVAGMLYSKYHGLLVVIFVFLSNLTLVKRKSAWLMVGLVVTALLPHLLWQIRHDFPTFRYHLVTRSEGFDPENILNYLYSQLLIAGPLVAPLVLYFSLSGKPDSLFERSLKFTLIGFLGFFLLSSFRDHVEAHWTAAAYIPMIVLAHRSLNRHEKAAKWIRNLGVPSIFLLLMLRFMVGSDTIPWSLKYLDEFNGWKEWAGEIKKTAQGRKVVFLNKYQYAAKYSYYTGDLSCSINDVFARKSQYNLWDFEDSLTGKSIMLNKSLQPEGMIKTPNRREHGYSFIENFQPYNRVATEVMLPSATLKANDTITLRGRLFTPAGYAIQFDPESKFRSVLSYTVRKKDGYFYQQHLPVKEYGSGDIPADASVEFSFTFVAPEEPGQYSLYIVYWLAAAGQMGDARPAAFRVQ